MTAPFHREHWSDRLHVIAVISNTQRYRTRYDLSLDFARRVEDAGATLWTTEAAFGDRQHAVTRPGHGRHLQLRTWSELWIKERLINLTVQRLPADWQYLAWIDADVAFARHDWAEETIHLLQHSPIVQLWSEAVDLGPQHQMLQRHQSFAWCYQQGYPTEHCHGLYHHRRPSPLNQWHPGFAWAIRRDAFEALGGLIDWGIAGAGDRHMAMSLIGYGAQSYHPGVHPRYKALVDLWQDRALRYLHRDVGCMEGLLLHHWHGKKRDRRYQDRWKILVRHQFDPDVDLKPDSQGLWQLTDRSPGLRDDLRRYFSGRSEDSIDVE